MHFAAVALLPQQLNFERKLKWLELSVLQHTLKVSGLV